MPQGAHQRRDGELLQPYFSVPDFNPEDASRPNAGRLVQLAAMKTYHEVAKVVDPKIMSLRAAEAGSRRRTGQQAAEDALAVVQESDAMQAKFDAAMAEKQRLEDDGLCAAQMDSATALISALAGEEACGRNSPSSSTCRSSG